MLSKSVRIAPFSPFSTVIVLLLLAIVGLAMLPLLSIQLLPSRTYAALTISASLSGASAEVTELELTSPIESVISRLKGISRLSSSTRDGGCQIRIQLDKWTNPEMFRFEVSTTLRQLYDKLPQNASYPQVSLNRPDDSKAQQALLAFTLSGPGTAEQVAQFAEQHIRTIAADIPGIDRFEISGAQPIRTAVYVDADKIQTIGLRLSDLQATLSQGMRSRDIGKVTLAQEQSTIVIEKAIQAQEDLLDFVVKEQQGRLFRLRDVAHVAEEIVPAEQYFRINGMEQVSLSFYAMENINSIRLAEKIQHTLKGVMERLTSDYRLELQFDQTEYIKAELAKIYWRTGLSIVILLLFAIAITRQLRYILIITAALLANVLLSFIFYYAFGLEIHLYSLAGITISLGLVIDNVIVIVEDIRHTGRNRIFAAILASTLTALGALSVIFLLGEEQKLQLLDFGIAIIINLLVSLPIAYFLIPALLQLFPVQIGKKRISVRQRRRTIRWQHYYTAQLLLMVRWRPVCITVFVLSFGLPLFLIPQKIKKEQNSWHKFYNATFGSTFYNEKLREPLQKYLGGTLYYYIRNQGNNPGFGQNDDTDEQTMLYVHISMPVGSSIEHMDAICREFEGLIANYRRDLEVFTTHVHSGTGADIILVFAKQVAAAIPYQLKNILERQAVMAGAADFSVHGVGRGFSNALYLDRFDSAIRLTGYNYQQLQALSLIVRDSLLKHRRVSDVLVSAQREWGQTQSYEHVVRFTDPAYLTLNRIGRRNMAQAMNLLAEQSAYAGSLQIEGGSREQQVYLHYHRGNSPDVWQAMHVPVHPNDSTVVKFADVSSRDKVKIGKQMVRENQEYVLYVNYRFIGTPQLNKLVNDRIVESIRPSLPFGYKIDDQRQRGWYEGKINYLWFIPLVLFIVYLICAILLESFQQAFAVIFMIPFSFIGMFLLFQVQGLRFDQGGYAAILMLSGLVTNAALYIINDLNYISKQTVRKARADADLYARAFGAKVIPIGITTLSAILSLLPFMLIGEDQGFWFTLSAGTIGGLLFSLLGAYLLLPLFLISRRGIIINTKKEHG